SSARGAKASRQSAGMAARVSDTLPSSHSALTWLPVIRASVYCGSGVRTGNPEGVDAEAGRRGRANDAADQVDSGSALLGERLPGARPCAGGSLLRACVLGAVAGIPRDCTGAGRQAAPRASS